MAIHNSWSHLILGTPWLHKLCRYIGMCWAVVINAKLLKITRFCLFISSISHKNLYSEILNCTFRFELSDGSYRNIFGSIFEGSQLRLVSEKK